MIGRFANVFAREERIGVFSAEQIIAKKPLCYYKNVFVLALASFIAFEVPVKQRKTDLKVAYDFLLLKLRKLCLKMMQQFGKSY